MHTAKEVIIGALEPGVLGGVPGACKAVAADIIERLEREGYKIVKATATATEYGWVIERGNSEPSAPDYWCGNGWSRDNLRAVRFARQIDAENTANGFDEDDRLATDKSHRVAEHGWG